MHVAGIFFYGSKTWFTVYVFYFILCVKLYCYCAITQRITWVKMVIT